MVIRWEALTIDARDPGMLARWWAQTLDWQLVDPDPAGTEVRPPDGHGPSLFVVPTDAGKQAKNRLHLDLYAEERTAAIDELLSRGASRVDVGQGADAGHVVLADPEGNEFCLLEPR